MTPDKKKVEAPKQTEFEKRQEKLTKGIEKLQDELNLDIHLELAYTKQGIFPRMLVNDRTNDEGKETESE